ncbi:hypothetical protein Asi02nite_49230 [Asanoa siamensis]|uniref:Uncharacterized protein n=1 Tax=Asanoa siamensis TaxID=926357 RepID=A0ABQ4CVV2_9ACTN|nr:hypothetical protein Asi02nite_49230 [Asanoa siamensis]
MLAVGLVLPPVVWWRGARTRRVGLVVGSVLAAWAVATVILYFAAPASRLEILIGYLPIAMAVVALGRAVERTRLGRAEWDQGWWLYLGSLLLAGFVSCCFGLIATMSSSEPFLPSADELLPVPAGLTAVVKERDAGSCGSGVCTLSITVTGSAGQTQDEVYARVHDHLVDRGWDLDEYSAGCRMTGWLIGRREVCVKVSNGEGAVRVWFEGARADPLPTPGGP